MDGVLGYQIGGLAFGVFMCALGVVLEKKFSIFDKVKSLIGK